MATLCRCGDEIINAKYETEFSSYTFGSAASDTAKPQDITDRHAAVDAHWKVLEEMECVECFQVLYFFGGTLVFLRRSGRNVLQCS